jgi:DNA polymerase III gamma/tau subunit
MERRVLTDPLPPKDGDAPLAELTRDALSVFLYLAFTDDELTELFRDVGISVPGFRTEKMSGVQKADHLADEIRERPDARKAVIGLLRKVYEFPALDAVPLTAPVAKELALLTEHDDFRILMLWRVLADPDAAVRKAAHESLDLLAKAFYGGSGSAQALPRKGAPQKDEGAKDLERELKRVQQLAESAEAKAESLSNQLKNARKEEAESKREMSQARKTAERAQDKVKDLEAQLEKARAREKGVPTEKQLRELEHQVEKLKEREAELAKELEAAKSAPAAAAQPPSAAPAAAVEEEGAVEEAPAGWSMPHFSDEFYDSLAGWDLRIQRAAFKQAYLLTENWRHPSLRALALEGLEGYYRVRVATDVRLIYKRSSEGKVDILSLIDREDLDRYVRQAKTR